MKREERREREEREKEKQIERDMVLQSFRSDFLFIESDHIGMFDHKGHQFLGITSKREVLHPILCNKFLEVLVSRQSDLVSLFNILFGGEELVFIVCEVLSVELVKCALVLFWEGGASRDRMNLHLWLVPVRGR